MQVSVRYVHTNIVAKNWKALARFYVEVFCCKVQPPGRNLKGSWLNRLTSLDNSRVRGIHLRLPGYGKGGPTLEIFQYSPMKKGKPSCINQPGFAHIAFSVRNVKAMLGKVCHHGGSSVGEIVSTEIDGVGFINLVYARDPEGNIIEIQKWE
jgi:predicted enzyme related to lactoylglutathione lyase